MKQYPVVNVGEGTNIRIYNADKVFIDECITGTCIGDKIHKALVFYHKNYGKMTIELIGDDVKEYIRELVREEVKNGG